MKKGYDTIIVGAGPAGMFAAYKLLDTKQKVLIIDKGPDIDTRVCHMEKTGTCIDCDPCQIMCGVGGAGTYSDGTLNLRPDIGGDLRQLTGKEDVAQQLVKEVDNIFLKFGAPPDMYSLSAGDVAELKRRSASAGINFIEIPQRHMGSDNAPLIIKAFYNHLKEGGIDFKLNTQVEDVILEKEKCVGVKTKKKKLQAKNILLAPGRVGAGWAQEVIARHKLKYSFGPIDVGVRVEVPSIIMDPVIRINRDPKFHIQTKRYDDFVRTFCTNHQGFVVKEKYDSHVGVNGHAMTKRKSENTNFSFLVRVSLTHPVENTIEYGKSIARLATTIGGGKPLIQRLGDLRRGRRSSEEGIARNSFQPTLKDVTPGDISMALPHRVVMNLMEGLEKLADVIPGVASDSTLLYAPEIKFYATQVKVDRNMATSVPGLYAAGDGMGLSRDIVNAAATGLLAGAGIAKSG